MKEENKPLKPDLADMERSEASAAVFSELRRLAAESPREARARFASLLNSNSTSLDEILDLASAPGEGRLRQLIANAVRNREDKPRVVPHLRRWHENEADEFTKAAVSAALADVETRTVQPFQPLDPPQLVQTYRYVADRLCHRVRNSLTGTAQHLRALEALLNGGTEPKSAEAKATVGQLRDALRAVSRIVEFNVDDSYFQWRFIELKPWLKSMTAQYIAKNSPLAVRIVDSEESRVVRINANDFLLETIFWNLWKNAQQAITSVCEVSVLLTMAGSRVQLILSDNGRGFTAEDAELAFIDRFSRRGTNYGRGLLEVQDAVGRLGGEVGLIQMAQGEYRIRLTLPLATQ